MIDIAIAVVAVLAGVAGGWLIARTRGRAPAGAGRVHRILLPFTGGAISRRALDAALRLARAEDATLMPAFLATVPRHLVVAAAVLGERRTDDGLHQVDAARRAAERDVAVGEAQHGFPFLIATV